MLCLATATHNFKMVKIAHMYLIWDQIFANSDGLNTNFISNNSDFIS